MSRQADDKTRGRAHRRWGSLRDDAGTTLISVMVAAAVMSVVIAVAVTVSARLEWSGRRLSAKIEANNDVRGLSNRLLYFFETRFRDGYTLGLKGVRYNPKAFIVRRARPVGWDAIGASFACRTVNANVAAAAARVSSTVALHDVLAASLADACHRPASLFKCAAGKRPVILVRYWRNGDVPAGKPKVDRIFPGDFNTSSDPIAGGLCAEELTLPPGEPPHELYVAMHMAYLREGRYAIARYEVIFPLYDIDKNSINANPNLTYLP